MQQYRFNISLPPRLQSQQSILEKLGKMVGLLNCVNIRDYPHIQESILFGVFWEIGMMPLP